MTTDEDGVSDDTPAEVTRMQHNLARIEQLSERLIAALARRRKIDPNLQGPGHDLYMKAGAAYLADAMMNPAKIFENQVNFWGKTLAHYLEFQESLARGGVSEQEETPDDPRFANPLWSTHPWFRYVRQQYEATSEALEKTLDNLDGLDERDRRRVEFFTHQLVDMLAPTNFLATNPDALARAVETEGESLVTGLENLVRDIESHEGELLVTLSDHDAFKVGENLATTPGQVVFRNRMFELIQYAPSTDEVRATPLVIFPPWINKFYILDLREKNSLIKWIVDQGYTLFVVSWVNPDASYADAGIDTYVEEGYLEAIRVAREITGEDQINVVGYCIGGTVLALALALMRKRGDKSVRAASFFTTLTDFSEQGDFTAFLTDDFVSGIEREVSEKGVLDSFFMTRTFSFLRANDLVYRPAVRSYMMGEAPPAFDLLYWNGDGTNLPARMVVEYLRLLCQRNLLSEGGFELAGETLSLRDVGHPLIAIACEKDHIAPWKPSMDGIRRMGSRSKRFLLAQSGHIAGIINPPTRNKYGHYTSEAPLSDPDAWHEAAEFHEGSWWRRWEAWLSRRSGRRVAARSPGSEDHPPLCPAPGTYVLARGGA